MAGQGAPELALDDVVLVARLAFLQLLADAQDRAEAGLDGATELATDELVGLARRRAGARSGRR